MSRFSTRDLRVQFERRTIKTLSRRTRVKGAFPRRQRSGVKYLIFFVYVLCFFFQINMCMRIPGKKRASPPKISIHPRLLKLTVIRAVSFIVMPSKKRCRNDEQVRGSGPMKINATDCLLSTLSFPSLMTPVHHHWLSATTNHLSAPLEEERAARKRNRCDFFWFENSLPSP
ncbi:hypothetical protein CDAR_43781 [Caerostris darwini]|uniref:Uncharacterized protein n=1 Tax=Caerostris darwini TaxID=1538125 RepID=A0AAV4WGT7_9ARAC|nr:hypothetical protein CDAR_43781 [Caerostris darwini]